MSRKGPSKKHQLLPDPIYGSTVVAQLINKILLDGKKSIAEDIVYSALDMVKEKTDQEPVAVLKRALDNIRPSLEVRSRRVGGATYQVPMEVRPARRVPCGGNRRRTRHRRNPLYCANPSCRNGAGCS